MDRLPESSHVPSALPAGHRGTAFLSALVPVLATICATYVLMNLGGQYTGKSRFFFLQIIAYVAGRFFFPRRPFKFIEIIEDVALLILSHATVRSMLESSEVENSDPAFLRGQLVIIFLYSFFYPLIRFKGGYQLSVLLVAILMFLPPYSTAFLIPVHTGSSAVILLLIALSLIFYSWIKSQSAFRLPAPWLSTLIGIYGCLVLFTIFHAEHIDAAVAHLQKTVAFIVLFLAVLQLQKNHEQYALFWKLLLVHLGLQAAWFLIGWLRNPGAQAVGLVNLNTAAMLLEVFLFLAVYRLLEITRTSARIALAISILLFLIVIALFESRGAYGGVLAGVGIWAVSRLSGGITRNPILRTGAIATGAGLILMLAVWILLEYYLNVIGKERAVLWSMSTAGVFESPWRTIFGYGTFGPYYLFRHDAGPIATEYIQSLPGWFWSTHPHSEYLSLLYGLGILGLLSHLAMVVSLIYMADSTAISSGAKAKAGGAVLAATVAIIFHGVVDPVAITFVTGLLFWLLLAEGANLQERFHTTISISGNKRLWIGSVTGIICLGMALALTRYEIREAQLLRGLLPHWHSAATQEKRFSPDEIQALRTSFDDYYSFLNSWSISDESFRLYAEMNHATLKKRYAPTDEAYGIEIDQIERAYCKAIQLRDHPLYYRRIRLMLAEEPGKNRTICDKDAAEFQRLENIRDPYKILEKMTAPSS